MENLKKIKRIILKEDLNDFIKNRKEIFSYLIENNSIFNEIISNKPFIDLLFEHDFLVHAAQHGKHELIKQLLKIKTNKKIDKFNYSFIFAAHHDNYDIIETLLKDNRLKPEDNDNLLLEILVNKKNIKIIKILLQNNNVCQQLDYKNLKSAMEVNSFSIAKLFYEQKYLRNKLTKEQIRTYNEFSIKQLNKKLSNF